MRPSLPTIGVLGPTVIFGDGAPIAVTGYPGRLLFHLAVSGPARTRSELLRALWPVEQPPTADAALRVHLSKLRRLLADGPVSLVSDGPGIRLEGAYTDLEHVDLLLTRARFLQDPDGTSRDPAAAAALVAEALAWWRGMPGEEVRFDDRSTPFIVRARERRDEAVELAVDLALQRGHHRQLIADLEEATRAEPFREHRWEQLMVALYRSGRQRDALAAFDRVRAHLIEELGIEPGPALQRTQHAVLLQDPALDWHPAGRQPVAHRTGLPDARAGARMDPVGREGVCATVADLLSRERLVSIVGPPGIGTSTVARAVATAQQISGGRQVWDLRLHTVRDTTLLPFAFADALGLHVDPGVTTDALDQAVALLTDLPSLIVLDGGEHLDLIDFVDRLLRIDPHVSVLCARRTPLGHPAEVSVALDLLAPDAALHLLRQRLDPSVATVTPSAALERIVAAVEGHPLALELVASWVELLGAESVVEQLTSGALPFTDEGDPPLLDRVRASLDLLDETTRRAFPALSVFLGDFDAVALGAVAGISTREAVAVLRDLRRASMVQPGQGTGQWRLLPAISETARALAEEAGVTAQVRDAHLDLLRDELRPWSWQAYGLDPIGVVRALDPWRADLRARLGEMIEQPDLDTAIDLFEGLFWYWDASGQHQEAVQAATRICEVAMTVGHPRVGRIRVAGILATGTFASISDHLADAERSLEEARGSGDHFGELFATITVAIGRAWSGDLTGSEALLETARTTTLDGAPFLHVMPTEYLGILHIGTGDFARSRELLEQARDGFAAMGSTWGEAHALTFLGLLATAEGDTPRAMACYRASVARAGQCGDRHSELHGRLGLADLLVLSGQRDEARAGYVEILEELLARGDLGCAAQCHCGLAEAADDDHVRLTHLAAAATLAERAADHGSFVRALAGLVEHLSAGGRPELAAQLVGAVDALPPGTGRPLRLADQARLTAGGEGLRDRLGSDAFEAAATAGRARGASSLLARIRTDLLLLSP